MITLNDYLTASGRYPEREHSEELTEELLDNANKLLEVVNAFLTELGISKTNITSGFRPSEVNANVANAAKKSNHTLCLAVDIMDSKDQILANKILARLDLLEKYDLYMESPKSTIGKNTNWVHLSIAKTKSGNRVFIP